MDSSSDGQDLADPSSGTRLYRGRTLQELLPQIREELGPDAVILRQREGRLGGVGGLFAQRCVEVEARAGGAGEADGSGGDRAGLEIEPPPVERQPPVPEPWVESQRAVAPGPVSERVAELEARLAAEREARRVAELEVELAVEREARRAAELEAELVNEHGGRRVAELEARLAVAREDRLAAERAAHAAAERSRSRSPGRISE